jgi:hypothetical protein
MLLQFLSAGAFSKDYDLLVFPGGDSIACRIDSITDTHIYYMVRNKYQWIHTYIELSRISYYKFEAINKKTVYFRPGTSRITQPDPNLQTGTSIKGGIGIPEMLNAGIRMQAPTFKVGFIVGGIPPIEGESFFTIAGDFYIHLGKKYIQKKKQPWCSLIGFSYLKNETNKYIESVVYLNLRLEKDIMLSEKWGLEIYFGMSIQLMSEYIEKEDNWLFFGISEAPVLPSGGISLFYKFR